MELWDVYDKNGAATGRTKRRGEAFAEGEYHIGVSLWIVNSAGEILIQKRSEEKSANPGMWSFTGGALLAGETSIQGCLREAREEIGLSLDASDVTLLSRVFWENSIFDDYIVEYEFSIENAALQAEEVSELKWASADEIRAMFGAGRFMLVDMSIIDTITEYIDGRKALRGPFARTALLIGAGGMRKLSAARVAVFGLGGVGGHCAEALARSGIGTLDFFDHDTVDITNINRQIIATHGNIGRFKADVMRGRALEINPGAAVGAHKIFYGPETAALIDLTQYDYIVDAVDNITAKLELACRCSALGVPVISAMGAGNRLNPALLTVGDIYETRVCPLARVMRRELRKRGVAALKVVYSTEPPVKTYGGQDGGAGNGRPTTASCAFVPAAAGLIMAGEVVRGLSSNSVFD